MGRYQSQPMQTHSISRKGHRSLVLSEASQQGRPEVTELAGSAESISGGVGVYHCAPTSITRQLSFGTSHRAVWGPRLSSQSHGQARAATPDQPKGMAGLGDGLWRCGWTRCDALLTRRGGQPARRGGKGIPSRHRNQRRRLCLNSHRDGRLTTSMGCHSFGDIRLRESSSHLWPKSRSLELPLALVTSPSTRST